MSRVKKPFLKYLRPLKWKEVFDFWRKNEASQANWIKAYKERGFDSWDAWREKYTKPLKCDQAEWHFYELVNPEKNISSFYGGPFKTWKKLYYKEKETLQFSELVKLPEIQKNKDINSLADNFPEKTIIIGLEVGKKIVIIEGMHRSCAIALLAKKRRKLKSIILIALAKYPENNLPAVGKFRKSK
ncbi:hypothetical protein KAI56_02475 [Candidatus Parcubacteria bacterium]|nr:hypothetical protein [Candidatus Parcubacteria bacterium]